MFESGAICLFLADYFAATSLHQPRATSLMPPPASASDRADCMMMLFFGACHMDTLLWDLRVNVDFLTNEDGSNAGNFLSYLLSYFLSIYLYICYLYDLDFSRLGCSELVIARAKQKWNEEVIPQLAARLTSHAYVCAFGFTVADIIIGYNLGWARKPAYKLAPYPPVIRSYLGSLASRPAFRQAYNSGKFVDVGPQFKAKFFPKL
jgi:glutathione S-transferase